MTAKKTVVDGELPYPSSTVDEHVRIFLDTTCYTIFNKTIAISILPICHYLIMQ